MTHGMFFPRRTEPLELALPMLHGLRLSLNTPVVSCPDLPVGPARAAIVVHEESDGRPGVTVGMRSLKTGEVVLFSYDGALQAEGARALGTEAALSFAESMGFLMDEDEIPPGGGDSEKALALGLWGELMGGGTPGASAEGPPAPAPAADDPGPDDELDFLDDSFDDGGDELVLLDEVDESGDTASFDDAEDTLSGAPPPDFDLPGPEDSQSALDRGTASDLFDFPEPRPSAPNPYAPEEDEDCELEFADGTDPHPPTEMPPVTLSKFRGTPAPADPGESGGATVPGSGKALGRLKLVKRRGAVEDEQRIVLLRLLSSY